MAGETSAYPLEWPDGWPRTPDHKRLVRSPFQTTFDRARRDLGDELRRLGAKHVVISCWLALRRDGQPSAEGARRRIVDPGVAVYFELRGKPMVMARDAYGTIHDNLRSIGLAIGHLRGMERHGGATMMDRAFEGFVALAAPGASPDWWMVLQVERNAGRAEIEAAFRRLARERHPDHGGSDHQMAEINAARAAGLAATRPTPES